jgi:hypothetical protein
MHLPETFDRESDEVELTNNFESIDASSFMKISRVGKSLYVL